MSGRQRRAWFAALWVLLVGGGGWLVLSSSPQEPPARWRAGAAEQYSARIVEAARSTLRERQATALYRERPLHGGDHHLRRQDRLALARAGKRASRVARRFFSVFSRYELGGFGRAVRRGLRESATRAFARELIAAPPRLDTAADERARLTDAEFVAGRVDTARGRLQDGELVGAVRRGAASSTVAIELVRAGQRWRVSGLGR